VVSGADAARGEALVRRFLARGTRARFVRADLSDRDDRARLLEECGAMTRVVNAMPGLCVFDLLASSAKDDGRTRANRDASRGKD
jgi:hypothetical protein